jgi:uncharacterized repeat protein (TIGR01451 family)
MKTKLLLLFAILSFGFTNAQIVNIPDPILKSRLLEATSNNGISSSQIPVYNSINGDWYVTSYNSIDSNSDGEIQVSEAQTIKWLALGDLGISDITGIEAFTNLEYLSLTGNLIQNFNVTHLTQLRYLNVGHNDLQSLDVTTFSSLAHLWAYNNELQSLFMKNNANWLRLSFELNYNLQYICADENDITFVQNKINQLGYISCHVNSYCSFNPGGTFYKINCNNRLDLNVDGCDDNDNFYPYLKINISNGSQSANFICNDQGNYIIPVLAGTHTLTPTLENLGYFTVANATVNFPSSTSPSNQDFCITANGIHHDVEVTILPLVARPGFDSYYTIVYKNKGTAIENGSIQFSYDDAVLDLVSAEPSFANQITNTLTWDFFNLYPFETRTIELVLNVNGPTETPAVNIGYDLGFNANISIPDNDEMPSDNSFGLKQVVVGSYDPNDKTCLQGEIISPSYIDNYVHYMIRFENTGTYPAENVVIKDIIDTSKFNVSSLTPISGSHSFVTKITNTNKVEFIFENINLPFDDANNDGYVAFKIKTKTNLVIGDTFSNYANIYFDYNFPITTNTYSTTIEALGINENSSNAKIVAYPNPVNDYINFNSYEEVIKVDIYDIAGRILSSNSVHDNKLNVSDLQSGNYILRIYTQNEITNTKIIKE